MTVLIPSIGSCTFDSGGERRLAERLEAKLEADYLCWYNVAVGPAALHPDFIVFHPRRGLLILEVKDWRARTILGADRSHFTIHTESGPKQVENPLEQARHYAHAAINILQSDPQLTFSSGRETVHTHHFHQWCRAQLVAYHVGLPQANDDKEAFFAEMVDRVIRAVERGQIPDLLRHHARALQGHLGRQDIRQTEGFTAVDARRRATARQSRRRGGRPL